MKRALLIILPFLLATCTKKSDREPNPFGNNSKPNNTNPLTPPDPNSIQGIYTNVFKPTCANSGCHDGTFEPDFRTIESAYNTLLYRPPIKNDTMINFAARVTPGNADLSMLWHRLTVNLGGNSGIMPLVVEPGTDWLAKKSQYLENIKTWINNGAKDQFGNNPVIPDQPPQVMGMVAMVNGQEAFRPGRYEPVQIPYGQSAEIWFCFADDKMAQTAMNNGTINFSKIPGQYTVSNAQALNKQATGLTTKSVYGNQELYLFKFSFSTTSWQQGDVVWLQAEISDGVNGKTAIPGPDALFYLKKYLAIRIL